MSRGQHWPRAKESDGLDDFHAAASMPGPERRRVGDPPPKRCPCCGAPVVVRGSAWWCSSSVGHPMGSGLPEARGSLWARDGVPWGALLEKLPGRAEPAFKARS
jgi:hypothetical protein